MMSRSSAPGARHPNRRFPGPSTHPVDPMREIRMLLRHTLAVAVLAVSMLAADRSSLRAAERAVINLAQIKLHGELDETPVSRDPVFGGGAENFKSKLDRIKRAKDDPDIQGLYLQMDGVGIGWGKLDELRH